MKFVIEPVTDSRSAAMAAHVREEVFGREWNLRVPPIAPRIGTEALTLIARAESHPEPAAVVTVIETTDEHELHRRLGLVFPERSRIARYMQLAVLKPYRGLNLPVQLVLEARTQFVKPRRMDYTWLLFDAKRASSSSFCQLLGFSASAETFSTEYGHSRVLVCNEAARLPALHDWSARSNHRTNGYARAASAAIHAVRQIRADEWVAQ
jgi:hypothetical protein